MWSFDMIKRKPPDDERSRDFEEFSLFVSFFFLITCSRGQEAKNVWGLTALVESNNNNI